MDPLFDFLRGNMKKRQIDKVDKKRKKRSLLSHKCNMEKNNSLNHAGATDSIEKFLVASRDNRYLEYDTINKWSKKNMQSENTNQ